MSTLALCACGGSGTSGIYNQTNDSHINVSDNDNQADGVSIEHLPELTLRVKGDRQFSTGNIEFSKSSNSDKVDSINLHDNWYNRDIIFSKNQNNKYHATPYSYILTNNHTGYIEVQSDTPLESIYDIKQKFLSVLETDYNGLSDDNKQNIINQINAISIDDAQITSRTEFTSRILNIPNKFYIIPTNMEVDINTYGHLVGLTYSDFGSLTGEQWTENYTDRENLGYVFAGGYSDKKITPSENTMNFTGKAVGHVMLHTEDDNGVATNDYMYIESDATLAFDNGTENINMNFSDNPDVNKKWYDVSITKNNDNITIDLTNGDKIAQANTKYKFSDAPVSKNGEYVNNNGVGGTDLILSNGWNRMEEVNVNTEYYGDNNHVSESVGTVSFVQQDWNPNSAADTELSFSATFGVKR